MLDIHSSVFHFDGFFHGNDVHTYSRAARGNHGSDFLQGEKSHSFKEHCKFRMVVQLLFYHIGKLGGTGYEHGKNVSSYLRSVFNRSVFRIIVAVVVFENTYVAHFFKKFFERRVVVLRIKLVNVFKSIMTSYFHCKSKINHFVGKNTRKSPVLGVVDGHAEQLVVDAVGNLSCQFKDVFSRIRVAHEFGNERFTHFGHYNFLLS